MKKYILFFISIGLLVGTVLTYKAISVEENKKSVFNESGYILNGSSERFYFNQSETYTTSYDSKISFTDTEGEKVTIDNGNFIHYSSGNIVGLQDSVLLVLNRITDNPIVYYNVGANREIKKVSDRYVIKNLNKDIQFDQGICKISANKYLILANDLTVSLSNGAKRNLKDYIEIEYSDNEIVTIYNQEINVKTISSNSYIELNNNIVLNLDKKIISKDGINRMSLEDMVINSDDNVTLIDINEKEESAEEDENTTNENTTNSNSGTTTSTTTNTTNNSSNNSGTVINNGGNGASNGENSSSNGENSFSPEENNTSEEEEEENPIISIDTPEIIYDFLKENESKVNKSITLAEPIFKFENMSVTAVGVSGTIQITDEDDLLSKDESIAIKIINDLTGKVVYSLNESYGTYNIPIFIETLIPNTQYTIITSATYTIEENNYTKNFLYKTFVTPSLGLEIQKEAATSSSFGVNIIFTDKLIQSAVVSLLDSNGNEIPNRSQTVRNASIEVNVNFEELRPNTEYKVRVSQIIYDGIAQEGENWIIEYNAKTLKTKASIDKLNYSINKRDGTITLYIEDVTDPNNSIQGFEYVVYELIETTDVNGKNVGTYNTEEIIYSRETNSKEITIDVLAENSESLIRRNHYYGFKVIATTFDNEKYVEIESNICGAFALNGVTFPSVKFEKFETDYPATEIEGYIYIIDNENALSVDNRNPLTVLYYSDVDENTVCVRKVSITADDRDVDKDGNNVVKLHVKIGGDGTDSNGLKSETTYTFAVYGSVDLNDDNGVYANTYIGGFLVTTGKYADLTVNMVTADIPTNTFTVEMNLEGDNISRRSLKQLDIMLYEGSGDINSGEYRNWQNTITTDNFSTYIDNAKYQDEINSLEDLVFDNKLLITPSLIGGGKESDYTEVNYQVVVTATVDGTTYSNKIPVTMQEDEDENTGNTTYRNKKTGQAYSAAYIIVNGIGTTNDVPNLEDIRTDIVGIVNGEANNFGLEKDENLKDNTIVGYKVNAEWHNTGSLTAKEITYYVWDKNGNAVLNEQGAQLTQTLKITSQSQAPSAIFTVGRGTLDDTATDNNTGLHRGNGYAFSYTIAYTDVNGNNIVWPMNLSDEEHIYTNKSTMTNSIYSMKQEPIFEIYPKISDLNSITYSYKCSDYDLALLYEDPDDTRTTNLTLFSETGNIIKSNVAVLTDGQEHDVVINQLTAERTYELKYSKNLNKALHSEFSYEELTKQKFEGIVQCEGITIDNIIYGEEGKPNILRVDLVGNKMERVAAARIILQKDNETMASQLLIPEKNGRKYTIDVGIIDFVKNSNFMNFIGTDVKVKVKVYFDNGITGFNANSTEYVTYINSSNKYLKFNDSTTKFEDNETIFGSIYESQFIKRDKYASLRFSTLEKINNNESEYNIILNYSQNGLKYGNNVIVQKELQEVEIDSEIEHTTNIQNVRLGISVLVKKATFNSATVNVELYNPLNINIDSFTVEILHSQERKEISELNWNDATLVEIDTINLGEFELNDLDFANYYYIRFKYLNDSEYLYAYDVDTKGEGEIYIFETVATLGIKNVEVKYETSSYINKNLAISYTINRERSNIFEMIKYTFYNEDDDTRVPLTSANIVAKGDSDNYFIENGSLFVENPKYGIENSQFESMDEKININPNNNVFVAGKMYRLEITPIVLMDDGSKVEIESVSCSNTFDTLIKPVVRLLMKREKINTLEGLNNKYIIATITIDDTMNAMYGAEEYGEYEIHIYRYAENKEQRQELNFYDSPTGENNLRGSIFNLNEHGTNFMVCLKPEDVDFAYNYVAEIKYKYDSKNKGFNQCEDRTESYLLSAINNELGVVLGSVSITENNNKLELRFYDDYDNIEKVDNIVYSILNMSDNTIKSGEFVPNGTNVNNTVDQISYYKIPLPETITEQGVYSIKMNLFSDDTLVGQIEQCYTYQPKE